MNNPLNLGDNPRARMVLYAVAFGASGLALFAPLVPGEIGNTVAMVLLNLSALATATATTTALSNIHQPTDDKSPTPR
jgi:hypothetical protein